MLIYCRDLYIWLESPSYDWKPRKNPAFYIFYLAKIWKNQAKISNRSIQNNQQISLSLSDPWIPWIWSRALHPWGNKFWSGGIISVDSADFLIFMLIPKEIQKMINSWSMKCKFMIHPIYIYSLKIKISNNYNNQLLCIFYEWHVFWYV